MKNNKISVIVTAYNAEKYIKKCLDSIIGQTYKNIEIIVINDCSSDDTKKIIGEYKNVKFIDNVENKGAAYSRNEALKIATGDYVGFIDSDDYIDCNYYEKMMGILIKEKSDIVISKIKIVYEKSQNILIANITDGNGEEKFNYINTGLIASPCNKLFKKEIIIKYPFMVGRMNEDIPTVIPSLIVANKITSVDGVYYYYVQHDSSVQNSAFSEKKFDIFYSVELCLKRIKGCKNYNKIKDAIIFNQIILLLIYVITKEKNKKYRYYILKKYSILSNKYNLRSNYLFWNFMASSGKKHEIYYRTLFRYICNGKIFLANQLISLYDILYKLLKRGPVIPKIINKQMVINAAKKQSELENSTIKISVIVPNYNYARFMLQRLYSVLNQDYKIFELIILDDCSKDNSREVIDDLSNRLKKYVNVKLAYNDTNSGSAFKQWQKGFEMATGDYVWIAEADDYCESDLISNLIKPIKNNNKVMISYSDTAFIDVFGNVTMNSIKQEIDIRKTNHWNRSYINNGINEIENYSYLNCTIANVSSCIIKRNDYTKYLNMSGKFHQAGDWLLYVNIMAMGDIAYTNKVLNYYRLHGDNVSSTMNHQKHIEEINKIHQYFIDNFKIGHEQKEEMKKRIKFLKKCWKLIILKHLRNMIN
jgi:glycosyltransferase involved in cell wall biosynthesis